MSAPIRVTDRWLERDGRPWFPVTGEIHYGRVPRERWSEVLGHARAGGLDSVASYVFWQAHEPAPGDFRWDGNLDLRAFVELAGAHGLEVVVRIGPWSHAEARYGGFPDWLVQRDLALRTDDPGYLALVRRLYGEIAAQLRGLLHADGGPVVGVQVENELYDDPGHLATLRRVAEEAGIYVPVWTATGWGGARLPENLLDVYSGYADGFWAESDDGWPDWAAQHFRYSTVRDDLGVGADVRAALADDGTVEGTGDAGTAPARPATPFATCELGGGMHVAYHRRPLVTPRDVAALALATIGSGSVWQGYYVYAGGTQRTGPHWTEQESQATGYPNDVPTLSYDFGAPVGEHGQIRAHHHLLRRQHLWLAADGAALATMPATVGGGSADPDELRWAVRSDGRRGYVFATTYQPAHSPLPAQRDVQLTVELDDGPVTVPSRPVDLPAGVSVVWPVRYPLTEALVLRSATAALLTRLEEGGPDGTPLVVLTATDGVPVELVLEGEVPVAGPVAAGTLDGGTVVTLTTAPGPGTTVDLPGVRLLVLDEASADQVYRFELGGRPRLLLSDVPLSVSPDARHLVAQTERPDVRIACWRPAQGWVSRTGAAPRAGRHRLAVDPAPHAPAPPAPRRGGPAHRLAAPTDFSGAARVRLDVPADLLDAPPGDRVLLRVAWSGDVGRAVVGDPLADGTVIGDHFWHGRDWDVDLTPWRDEVARDGLTLELLPWRRATGVRVDPAVRDVPDGARIRSVDVVHVARVGLAVPPPSDDEQETR
ncbi:beta-galactosidase [Isoptericola haloaureus]|uniref:Beta-galactosidase n=1 Tax=Isoptericola haloaureus TaxID=1542902 RepID=A0ABU7ZAH5_9MICO